MSIRPLDVEIFNPEDLLYDPIANTTTERDQIILQDPTRYYDRAVVQSFAQNVAEVINALPPSGANSDIARFATELSTLDTDTLATYLYASGIEEQDIDVSNWTIDDLTRIAQGVNGAIDSAAGGIASVLVSSARTLSFANTSFNTANLEFQVQQFASGVERDVQALIEAASKQTQEIADDVVAAANAAAQAIESAFEAIVDSDDPLTLADISDFVNDKAAAIENVRLDSLADVQSILPSNLVGQTDIVQDVIADLATIANTSSATVNALINSQTTADDNTPTLQRTRVNRLVKERLAVTDFTISDVNQTRLSAQAAAVNQQAVQANIEANTESVRNVAELQQVQGVQYAREQLDKRTHCNLIRARQSQGALADLRAAGQDQAFTPAADGRGVVVPSSLNDRANAFANAVYISSDMFFPSRYADGIAGKLNELHPDIRSRYTQAIVEWIDTAPDGFEIRITSAFRSLAKQQSLYNELRPQGKAVAFPGNSWHNYGLAIDIAIHFNNKRIQREGPYVGFTRDIFAKYNLHNPIARDRIHFQPTEIPISPRSIKNQLVTRKGNVNQRAVAALLDKTNSPNVWS